MRCRTAIVGTILTVALSLIASPLAAQQVVEMAAEDRLLDADFEEVYRVGAMRIAMLSDGCAGVNRCSRRSKG